MPILEERRVVNDKFNDVIERGDINMAVSHFTKDGICVAPDTPIVRGQAALPELFQIWIDADITNLRDYNHDAQSMGDVAFMVCGYMCDYQPEDGESTSERGEVLQVFKRDDSGVWRIHRFGMSTDIA